MSNLESRIRNETRQLVNDDLAACIEALEDIATHTLPSSSRGREAMRKAAVGLIARATVGLDSIFTPTTCQSCDGRGGGICRKCHGARCIACHQSGSFTCENCGGSGAV
jgi:hypothetical protein